MVFIGLLIYLFCWCGRTGAWLSWGDSYTLEAVLTVPAAHLSEPYQVWVDGDAKKSRVDFYNGIVKLYRQWDSVLENYQYFKIHPETTNKYTNKNVCHIMSPDTTETKMYAINTYLPNKNFKYQHDVFVNGTEAQKWEVSYTLDHQLDINVIYMVWVTFHDTTPIPLRYVYEMKIGHRRLDYFSHDYTYYVNGRPDKLLVQKPLGLQCTSLDSAPGEPFDPLLEYIEPELEHSRVNNEFDRFKLKHNKYYGNAEEEMKRLIIFKNNLRYIHSVNKEHRSYFLAVNHLADLTVKEMSSIMGMRPLNTGNRKYTDDFLDNDDDIEDLDGDNASFDWRDYNAVTLVKDQTPLCGSCYAFTTAAAIESSAYVARGCKHLVEVSEQSILDCTWGNGGNIGCSGGTYQYTLKWIEMNGIPLKEEYGPYLALEGLCHNKNMTKLVTIQGFKELEKKKRVIKDTLREKGPLLAAIYADLRSFTLYGGGIYTDPKCTSDKLTHGVTIVGYGRESGQEYWIIKNSFGSIWGEDGYMRLAMKYNLCGLKNCVFSVHYKTSKVDQCVKKE